MISNGIKRIKGLLFQNRSERQTVTKNIFWLSSSQIGSRLIRAVIIIYAARVLGAAEYGIFSYALGIAAFFTIFADIGISQIITRDLAQKPEKEMQYFSTAFWLKILVLSITTILLLFVAPYFTKIEAARILIPFIAIITIFDGLREFSLGLFRAKEKMELEALISVFTNISITIFGFIALYISANAKSLTFSYAASTALGFLVSLIIARKYYSKVFTNFRKDLLRPIFTSAYPIALLAFLGAFMLNTDFIMLGWWRTSEEIGYYSASQKIIQLLYSLGAIIATSLFPLLSRLVASKESDRVKNLMGRGLTMVFFMSIPIFAGGAILAKPIIALVYGQEYLPATSSFQILVLTPFFIFPQLLLGNFILAHNQQKKLKLPAALGSIGNIVFNIILIPLYGIAGCSMATVLAQLLNTSITWAIAKKINNFQTIKNLKKIIASAIIMGVISFSLNKIGLNVVINIILSAGIYLGILFALKESILNEFKTLLSAFKKK